MANRGNKPNKNNKLGYLHISYNATKQFVVQIARDKKKFSKVYPTLNEAIIARNSFIKNYETLH